MKVRGEIITVKEKRSGKTGCLSLKLSGTPFRRILPSLFIPEKNNRIKLPYDMLNPANQNLSHQPDSLKQKNRNKETALNKCVNVLPNFH